MSTVILTVKDSIEQDTNEPSVSKGNSNAMPQAGLTSGDLLLGALQAIAAAVSSFKRV